MVARKIRGKALFIDDAFARPTVAQFQPYVGALRRLLSDNGNAKDWMEKEYGLSGNHGVRSYFNPLTSNPDEVLRFWHGRNSSPYAEEFNKIFSNLVHELSPHHSPLESIESLLTSHGWSIKKSAVLPELDSVDLDVSLIVIDYHLSESADELEVKVAESIAFLRSLVDRAKSSADATHPFIILISSLPHIAPRHASEFRLGCSAPGGMFRFVKKLNVDSDFVQAVESFYAQREELQKFRRLHVELERTVAKATLQLCQQIENLELEDLATLYTAQLVTEKEPLSDYVGWLAGQLVMSAVQSSAELAERAMDLPSESYEILLGHCQPTQHLSGIFSKFSSVRSAAGELIKSKSKKREVRFGDIYMKNPKANALASDELPYYLVISQTCDLLQGKITNDQVLCVQGAGREVRSTEIDLLTSTIRQMGVGGDFLIKDKEAFYQVGWSEKNLLSIDNKKLAKETGYTYVGRLNEIYALEVQHSALHALGRIGVPVVPGYRVFFGVVELKVFNGKGVEILEFRRILNDSSVLSVLRNEKVGSVRLRMLLSGELRRWLYSQVSSYIAHAAFPENIKKGAAELCTAVSAPGSYSICGKSKGDEIEGFTTFTSIQVVLKGLPQIIKSGVQARIQIDFTPSIQFSNEGALGAVQA